MDLPGTRHGESGLAESGCLTKNCHASVLSASRLHRPARDGECAVCHEQIRSDHPDGEGWEFGRVMGRNPLVCFDCHFVIENNPVNEHKPWRTGHCMECHEPHGSDLPALARKGVEGLCLYCHQDLAARLERVSVRHGDEDESCVTTCHAPHSSEFRSLLRQPQEVLCVTCHETSESCLSGSSPGTGNREGACTTCHFAHGSVLPNMLKINNLLPGRRP